MKYTHGRVPHENILRTASKKNMKNAIRSNILLTEVTLSLFSSRPDEATKAQADADSNGSDGEHDQNFKPCRFDDPAGA